MAAAKKEYSVTISSIPATVVEFTKMRNAVALTPEGGVAMLLVALKMYQDNKTEGYKALVMITDKSALVKSTRKGNYKGYVLGGYTPYSLNSSFGRHPYLGASYFPGTSPKDGYKLSSSSWNFNFTPHKHRKQTDTKHTLFVPCSGADSDRPVEVLKNNKGIWKAKNYSSILVGIRKPENIVVDDEL